MTDDRLIRDLRALEREIAVDPVFADRLFERLRPERRPRSRRLSYLLLAATLLIGASVVGVVVGGGAPRPSDAPTAHPPQTASWILAAKGGEITVSGALPSDLDLSVVADGRSIVVTAGAGGVDALDGATAIPPGARGVTIVDVSGATAHYSNGRPVGIDAASFLDGLATHPILDIEVGNVTPTQVGGRPASVADLRAGDGDAHLDKGDRSIDLRPPSRSIVVDVGNAIILIQVWAATETDLTAWLPVADRLVSTLRLDQGT